MSQEKKDRIIQDLATIKDRLETSKRELAQCEEERQGLIDSAASEASSRLSREV